MKKAMNQSKLISILNGISILALAIMLILLLAYSSINSKLVTDTEKRFALTQSANQFKDGSAYLTNEVRAYAATGDKTHYDNYYNEVNNLKNRDKGVASMQAIGITAAEQDMINQMSSLSNKLVPLEEEAMRNVQEGNLQEAIDYVYGSDYSNSLTKINSLK